MPTGESIMSASPQTPEQTKKQDFKSWVEIINGLVVFKPENMPLKAYDDVDFYKYQKSIGLRDESPEVQNTFSKFKSKTNQNLADFWAYYEKIKEEAKRE